MKFNSLSSFAQHLPKLILAEEVALHEGLELAAKLVQASAKKEIGHLQPGVGAFKAWAELSESTKEDKERKGYVFNEDYNPLFRTGELQNSIQYEVHPLEAIIGSTSPIMAYQEFGTERIPPRAVMGPAAFKNKTKIRAILGAAAITGLTFGKRIAQSLGYDMDTNQ